MTVRSLLLAVLLLPALAFAQVMRIDTTTREPFFKSTKFDSKAFVGIRAGASQYMKSAGMSVGFSLNWLVNHQYVVGAAYEGFTTKKNVQPFVEPTLTDTIPLSYQMLTLQVGYILFANKKFSLEPELGAGWGLIRYRYHGKIPKNFAVISPTVYGIYNVHKNIRMGVGMYYRAAIGGQFKDIRNAWLSGVGGCVFFRVGLF